MGSCVADCMYKIQVQNRQTFTALTAPAAAADSQNSVQQHSNIPAAS